LRGGLVIGAKFIALVAAEVLLEQKRQRRMAGWLSAADHANTVSHIAPHAPWPAIDPMST
jgi:hypothetical protein